MSSILDKGWRNRYRNLDATMSNQPGGESPEWTRGELRDNIRRSAADAIGARILALRKARNWTAQDLSNETGIPRTRISAFEKGKALPDVVTLIFLATALGDDAGLFVSAADAAATAVLKENLGRRFEETKALATTTRAEMERLRALHQIKDATLGISQLPDLEEGDRGLQSDERFRRIEERVDLLTGLIKAMAEARAETLEAEVAGERPQQKRSAGT